MAIANCSVCGGGINTESSPEGKCVRCTEGKGPGKSAASTQKAGTFGNPAAADTRPEPRVATNPNKNEQEAKTALADAKKEATGDDEDSPFGETHGAETHGKGEHARKHR